jgi:hypothetical protein
MYLVAAFVTACLSFSGATPAQKNPTVGTWNLNVAKSKFVGVPAPKSLTRTVEAQGDSVKYSFEGVAEDGSALKYSFTVKYDGNDNPVTGSGMPFGADTIAIKRTSSNGTVATLKKAGTVVAKAKTEVSADGKTLKLMYLGTGGKPSGTVVVYEKQ